jgi:hypothetical protein
MGIVDWFEDTFVDPVVDLAEGTANFFEGVGGALSGDNFGESMGKAFGGQRKPCNFHSIGINTIIENQWY